MTQHPPASIGPSRSDDWAVVVGEQIARIRYGLIQLTIHDGRIVQIDATERKRLPCRGATGKEANPDD